MDTEKVSPLVLPDSQRYLLRKSDLLPSKFEEGRHFPRRYWVKQTKLRCISPFALPGRSSVPRDIIVIDLSRGGIRFFCGDILFPTELVEVELADEKSYRLQVV